MNIQKYNNDFFGLPSHIDGFFDNFFSPAPQRRPEKSFSNFLNPISAIAEHDQHYAISIDLPGIKKEDIQIEMKNSRLIISGERKDSSEGNTLMSEIQYGRFERSFKLPHLSDSSVVKAEFKDGQLNITVQKTEKEQSKVIPIK